MNRQFHVLVYRSGNKRAVRYPALEGEQALALMERLARGGIRSHRMEAYTVSAYAVEYNITLDSMRNLYGPGWAAICRAAETGAA